MSVMLISLNRTKKVKMNFRDVLRLARMNAMRRRMEAEQMRYRIRQGVSQAEEAAKRGDTDGVQAALQSAMNSVFGQGATAVRVREIDHSDAELMAKLPKKAIH